MKLKLALLLLVAVSGSSARAEGAPITREEVASLYGKLADACRNEDASAATAVFGGEAGASAAVMWQQLFRDRNYLVLTCDILDVRPLPPDGVQVDLMMNLRSRLVAEPVDRRERERWMHRVTRDASGALHVVQLAPAPPQRMPAQSWFPTRLAGRIRLSPAATAGATPEGVVDIDLKLEVRNGGLVPASDLAFALDGHARNVRVRTEGGADIAFVREQNTLDAYHGSLSAEVPPGEATTLHVTYSIDEVGASDDSSVGRDGAQLFARSAFLPVLRAPRRDTPSRQNSDLVIEAPADWVSLAPGRLDSDVPAGAGFRARRFVSELPGGEIGIVAGRFEQEEVVLPEGVTLELWRRAGTKPVAALPLARAAAEATAWYVKTFGPCPLTRIRIAELRGEGQREAAGFMCVPDLGLSDDRDLKRGAFSPTWFLATGLARTWTLYGVDAAGPGTEPLTLGLSEHLATTWFEVSGHEEAASKHRRQAIMAAGGSADVDPPLTTLVDEAPLSDLFALGKTAVVLAAFHDLAGSERWRQSLAQYFAAHRGRRARWEDFVRALVQDEAKWKPFAEAWLYGRGMADLGVSDVSEVDAGSGRKRIGIEVSNSGPGPLPVELIVRVADESYTLHGEVGADAATMFELEAPGRPSSIVVDPRSLCWDKNPANNKWPDFRVPRREIFKSKARADGRESLVDPERVKIHP